MTPAAGIKQGGLSTGASRTNSLGVKPDRRQLRCPYKGYSLKSPLTPAKSRCGNHSVRVRVSPRYLRIVSNNAVSWALAALEVFVTTASTADSAIQGCTGSDQDRHIGMVTDKDWVWIPIVRMSISSGDCSIGDSVCGHRGISARRWVDVAFCGSGKQSYKAGAMLPLRRMTESLR